jgi:succinate dehydrogenase hydrophobic anchor subunit
MVQTLSRNYVKQSLFLTALVSFFYAITISYILYVYNIHINSELWYRAAMSNIEEQVLYLPIQTQLTDQIFLLLFLLFFFLFSFSYKHIIFGLNNIILDYVNDRKNRLFFLICSILLLIIATIELLYL